MLPEGVSNLPQELLVSAALDSKAALFAWGGPHADPPTCSGHRVRGAGTTTLPFSGISDSHAEQHRYLVLSERWAPARHGSNHQMHTRALPWQAKPLDHQSSHTGQWTDVSMVKSPGSQLPTDKYITCTERKKQTQNYLYNSQSWINCMTSEDEPHTGTGSWPLVMHRHGQKESKPRGVMRKLVDVCKSHIVPCFDSPASLEQSYKVRKWQRRGLRAWKTLSHKAT